jgi:hypothetical protein
VIVPDDISVHVEGCDRTGTVAEGGAQALSLGGERGESVTELRVLRDVPRGIESIARAR